MDVAPPKGTDVTDSSTNLPLLELFSRLQDAGLPLGIEEYKLLLHSLQAGFGLPDRAALLRLCCTLWVKSPEETELFRYHFDQVMRPETMSAPEQRKNKADDDQNGEVRDNTNALATSTLPTAQTPSFVSDTEDEIQVAQAVQTTAWEEDSLTERFLLTSDYLPITRRQMKRSWRYLRQMVREGPPTELDIEATVAAIGQRGILLEPVLVPRRINRTELLLLLDQDGSMVPFHMLSHRLAETALRGGRLGQANIYYFHNCPIDYLFHDPYRQDAVLIENLLQQFHYQHARVLIFSDAGAARGGFNPDRLKLTQVFVEKLRQTMRYMVWLNPMPHSRWSGTTAGAIADLIPMFEMSRHGMDEAVRALLGRSTQRKEPV